MKKLLLTTAIALAMGSTVAFAHHPAEEFVDPDIYAMIDENVSDAHLALDFTDMGSADVMGGDPDVGGDTDVGGNAAAIDTEGVGAEMSGDVEDVGAAAEQREEMNATAASAPGAQR